MPWLPSCHVIISMCTTPQVLFAHYGSLGNALLSSFLVMFGNEDPRLALETAWPQVATTLLCIYNFLLIVVLLNMLITLMADVYNSVVKNQHYVFMQGRAELIIEVRYVSVLCPTHVLMFQ